MARKLRPPPPPSGAAFTAFGSRHSPTGDDDFVTVDLQPYARVGEGRYRKVCNSPKSAAFPHQNDTLSTGDAVPFRLTKSREIPMAEAYPKGYFPGVWVPGSPTLYCSLGCAGSLCYAGSVGCAGSLGSTA